MFKLATSLVLILGLSGCEAYDKFSTRDPNREVIAACGAIAHALAVLTPNKARLSEAQISAVDQADAVARPICTADSPPASQLQFVLTALAGIAAVQTAALGGN